MISRVVEGFRWSRLLDLAAPLGLSAFILAVAALHGLRGYLDPIEHTISEYSLGGYGWLMHAAFVALGLGVLATAWGLRLKDPPSRWWNVAVALLLASAIGLFLDAGFNTDHLRVPETTDGTVHGTGTLLAVLMLPASAFTFGSVLKHRGAVPLRARWLQALAVAQFLAILAYESSPVAYRGLVERTVMVIAIANLSLLQTVALRNPQRPPGSARSSGLRPDLQSDPAEKAPRGFDRPECLP